MYKAQAIALGASRAFWKRADELYIFIRGSNDFLAFSPPGEAIKRVVFTLLAGFAFAIIQGANDRWHTP